MKVPIDLPHAGTRPSSETLAQVADALPWPLMVLRPEGLLLYANQAAHQALQRATPLRLTPQQRVVPLGGPSEFLHALQQAAQGTPQVLRWHTAQGDATATLTPLAGSDGEALVLLALNAEGSRHAELRAYAHAQGLTDAETRVLTHLARGESSGTVAAALGLSAATVRSQIVSLRRKTGHANVPDLIRTLAALPPLGGKGE